MDTSETGLEKIIVDWLRDKNGYEQATPHDYNKDFALVDTWVERFVVATQPDKVEQSMCFASPSERMKFFTRLANEITKRGVVDVLRKGYKFNGSTFDLYYPLPSDLNPSAKKAYGQNIFGVIRQVMYSKTNTNEIDFVVFINGLPLATFELKNNYTGQTYENAIRQYQTDRNPKELLLQKKRCAVHFAVDDQQVWMCTALAGKDSWFLPFNRGVNGGAGNPVVENDTMTSYLWNDILTKPTLSNIIENFAQVIVSKEKDMKTGKIRDKEKVIWPRYHQLDAVRTLVKQTQKCGVGKRFLIQHSAGSGKSNTITWLAYQLVVLLKNQQPFFDSVVVVTDRVNLDRQIRDNINAFQRLSNIVGWADKSETLRLMLQGGKKIIVSTINKFSFILDEIGSTLKDRRFAIIIDEAHSSQNGAMSANLATGLSGYAAPKAYVIPCVCEAGMVASGGPDVDVDIETEEEDTDDKINRILKGRKLAKNANYYAFTATPKNKTLEMFGEKITDAEGNVSFVPFHEYTMKQAIEEGFILDVLKYYTPYSSYYRILKTSVDDPEYDRKKAQGKLRAYVEAQPETTEKKAEIIVEHFCSKVFMKIGGKARAMLVTSSIERAIEFYKVITRMLEERNSPYRAIVAFTDKMIDGQLVTEASLNGFPSAEIETKMEEEPYRILIVANKFQTGYDQPLLHTMYVDKQLSGVKAVQTLSRLNRCHPKKQDTFVLDFANDPEMIQKAFQDYYKTTVLVGESDVNKLNDLTETIEGFCFYTQDDVDRVVELKLTGNDDDRPAMDAVLDGVTERFKEELNEDEQIVCKSGIKNFNRCYPYFSSIMPFESAEWEKQYIFYSLLVKKLPKLKIDDFTEGLIDNIDFDKYRIVKEEERQIVLENENAEVAPVPVGHGTGKPVPEMEALSTIVKDFNELFGNIDWKNRDEVQRQINELPERIAGSVDFANAVKNGDSQVAQITFNDDMIAIVAAMLEEKTEFVQTYFGNKDFQNFVNARVYQAAVSRLRG
ncbi:type I restriction endonuclease subunit R [Prevotella sp.]|mgnify:FL=1|uniref:type I restriction endonuclease subunit R n=1 Tax=Prevotella sp. TaxID=59823 RepID=UPI0025EEEF5C|nr:type I restriction endonuclease [Prevotella sp.]